MKTQYFNFFGGLLTGALVVTLFSSSLDRSIPEADPPVISRPGDIEYVEVPIDEFFKDVARYRVTHAEVVGPNMPGQARDKASRMFLYSVNVLEDFISLVKKYGKNSGIKPDDLAIRFYYGVYPRGQIIKGQDYSSLHTLFMVPNVWSEKEQRFIDTHISQLARDVKLNRSDFKKDPNQFIARYYIENIYRANNEATMFMLDASAVRYTGKDSVYRKAAFIPSFMPPPPVVINQGQLCPPNCPTLSLLNEIDRIYASPQPGW